MKLGLGTVQFGLHYGISNPQGKTPESEVRRMLRIASAAGIRVLDTARSYGDAEAILGRCAGTGREFRIITKIAPVQRRVNAGLGHAKQLVQQDFRRSLAELGVTRVYGLLVHDADDLAGPNADEIWDSMQALQDSGHAERVGASAYRPEQLERLPARFRFGLVQVPVNIFDRRWIENGILDSIRASGAYVHARSVFLQGLLLMDPEHIPASMAHVKPLLTETRRRLRGSGLSPLQAALRFVLDQDAVDLAIVGATDAVQLKEIVEAASTPSPRLVELPSCNDERVVDPSKWVK